jgi:hypothetical protein
MPTALEWERDEDFDEDDRQNCHVAYTDEFILVVWSDQSGSEWSYTVEPKDNEDEEEESGQGFKSLEEAQRDAEEVAEDWANS